VSVNLLSGEFLMTATAREELEWLAVAVSSKPDRPSESGIYAGADLSYLERLCIDAGFCANCCIAEAMDEEHRDCAGPEGYWCDCPCEGKEHMDNQNKEPTIAQRLVRLALSSEDRTMVSLAEEMGVTRQTIHLWNTGESKTSPKHKATLLAIIGMDEADLEEAREEVLNLRLQLEEMSQEKWNVDEKLLEAEMELKGFLNGETEREMKAVSMRFAELIDREENRADEIESLKEDNVVLTNRIKGLEEQLSAQVGSKDS
jgi:hypothetical protein